MANFRAYMYFNQNFDNKSYLRCLKILILLAVSKLAAKKC